MSTALQDKSITLLADHKKNMQTQASQLDYLERGRPERERLEGFIRSVFKKYYNAELDHFYPNLLTIEAEPEQAGDETIIKAVAGVRCAADEPLFSEYYLNHDLETELQNLYGKAISRDSVVEVGNLAPANVGQMRWLIASITAFLYSAGFKYIVFTAVPGVYNAFKRMDVPLKQMTEANRDCLPDALKDKWGPEYYDLKPVVIAGNIAAGFEIMKQNIYGTNQKLIPLFEKACQLGQDVLAKRIRSISDQGKVA